MQQKKKSILVDAHIFDKEPQGTTTYIKGLYNAFIELFGNDYDFQEEDAEVILTWMENQI